jgi:mannose-6-phosphate isomerase-like protein (cupin superfamily)
MNEPIKTKMSSNDKANSSRCSGEVAPSADQIADRNKSQSYCSKDSSSVAGYEVVDLNQVEAVECPCGMSKRAFVSPDNPVATLHVVDISIDAKTHYHKKLTEIYYILETEGKAFMELDGELIPVTPGTTILIKPGTRHRAVGKMKIINVPVPAFDPNDEWFD